MGGWVVAVSPKNIWWAGGGGGGVSLQKIIMNEQWKTLIGAVPMATYHGSKRRELAQHAHTRGSHAFTHSDTYINTVTTTLCEASAQLLQNLESNFILKVPEYQRRGWGDWLWILSKELLISEGEWRWGEGYCLQRKRISECTGRSEIYL